MGSALPIIASGIGVAKGINDYAEGEQDKRRVKNAGKEADAKREQLSLRQEATYRTSRTGLQGAIEDFYKQKGWKLPEHLPGAFTTRPLPGDAPLYPGYDINPSEWTHEPVTDDEEAGAQASTASQTSEPGAEEVSIAPQAQGQVAPQAPVLPNGIAEVKTNVVAPKPISIAMNPLNDLVYRVGQRYG